MGMESSNKRLHGDTFHWMKAFLTLLVANILIDLKVTELFACNKKLRKNHHRLIRLKVIDEMNYRN